MKAPLGRVLFYLELIIIFVSIIPSTLSYSASVRLSIAKTTIINVVGYARLCFLNKAFD